MSTSQIQLDYGALLSEAWDKLKDNLLTFLIAIVILVAISLGVQLIPVVGTIASLVIAGPLALGLALMSLNAARGNQVELGQLFAGFSQFVAAAIAGVLLNIFSIIGFALCFVPGVVVMAFYMFTFYFMATGVGNFWTAMESSRTKVMENFMPWFLFALLLMGINLVGALLLGVGLLITAPLTWIAVAIAFDRYLNPTMTPNAGGDDFQGTDEGGAPMG